MSSIQPALVSSAGEGLLFRVVCYYSSEVLNINLLNFFRFYVFSCVNRGTYEQFQKPQSPCYSKAPVAARGKGLNNSVPLFKGGQLLVLSVFFLETSQQCKACPVLLISVPLAGLFMFLVGSVQPIFLDVPQPALLFCLFYCHSVVHCEE